jgi:hypothetical protein
VLTRLPATCLRTLILTAVTAASAVAAPPPRVPPPVRHVFVLLLENESFQTTFAPQSPAPYLAQTLVRQGALLENYFGVGHYSLDNYLALISGQAPNEETQQDCLVFSDFRPGGDADANGQLPGSGCVYPHGLRTLPDQLEAAGYSWKAYLEDMGNNPAREASTCAHVPVGANETTDAAQIGDQYATKHNPFVYFHSIIDDQARCDAHVVNLAHLAQDLRNVATTANYVFITPNLCHDGHDDPCVDGRQGGLRAADQFLREWVPRIRNSPAFRADGVLIVTFDEAGTLGPIGSVACCGPQPLPGARFPPGLNGPGGGRIGAVVLSRFVKPGTRSQVPYNHYSTLRTVEEIFGLDLLGYAAAPAVQPFGSDVFSAAAPRPPARSGR